MNLYVTQFRAICARTGEMKLYAGPHVPGLTEAMAQQWCYDNAGHLVVMGQLIGEIPCKPGTYEADFDNMVHYGENNN